MGSTGTSPSGAQSTSPQDIATEVSWQGYTIDLTESPLVYGEHMDLGQADQTIKTFEAKHATRKTEYSLLTMSDGIVIEKNHGTKKGVAASNTAREKADILSHIHPREGKESGIIGGTFSSGDLKNFVNFHQKIYRAVAKEGTYSIQKGANFNGEELVKEYNKFANTLHSPKAVNDAYNAHVYDNSYETYLKDFYSAANKDMVALHNWLASHATQYGYTYTLERRD